MISCPHCEALNVADAATCQACGKELAVAAASGELPPWLQALKPEHLKGSEDETGVNAPEPVAVGGATLAAAGGGSAGTDTLVATQPAPATRPVAPVAASPVESSPAKSAARPSVGGASETASLINEDDLPAWLRAFSETETSTKAANTDDQSWMLGSAGEGSADTVAENLAQSWQAPARVAVSARTGAASVFAAPTDGPTKVAKVAKPERAVAAPPAAAPAAKPAISLTGAKPTPATPARLGVNRAAPAQQERGGGSLQRAAVIAFLLALVVFLIVLGIFVVGPTLAS